MAISHFDIRKKKKMELQKIVLERQKFIFYQLFWNWVLSICYIFQIYLQYPTSGISDS